MYIICVWAGNGAFGPSIKSEVDFESISSANEIGID